MDRTAKTRSCAPGAALFLVSFTTSAALAETHHISVSAFEALRGDRMILSPATDAALFVPCVDNPRLPFIPGTVWHFEENTENGIDEVTISVKKRTKTILGIEATVVHDIVRNNGRTVEDTIDWYAQDDRGNVWYLGEETAEYEDGELASRRGSWQAGTGGAKAGIVMLADPRPGDMYFQEYSRGEAEDMGAVEALSDPVSVAYGDFDSALRTADYNPLDPSLERKWYVEGIGVVKAISADGTSTEHLVRIEHDPSQSDPDRQCGVSGGVKRVSD